MLFSEYSIHLKRLPMVKVEKRKRSFVKDMKGKARVCLVFGGPPSADAHDAGTESFKLAVKMFGFYAVRHEKSYCNNPTINQYVKCKDTHQDRNYETSMVHDF